MLFRRENHQSRRLGSLSVNTIVSWRTAVRSGEGRQGHCRNPLRSDWLRGGGGGAPCMELWPTRSDEPRPPVGSHRANAIHPPRLAGLGLDLDYPGLEPHVGPFGGSC